MEDTIFDIAKVLIPGLLLSIFTAIVTVRLSLRRFCSERLWERKMDSYTSIFEALYKLKRYYQKKRDIDLNERILKKDKALLLEQQWDDVDMEVSKAEDIGSFVICQEAIDCLKEYRKHYRLSIEDYEISDVASQEITYLNACINSLKSIAQRDLGVPNKNNTPSSSKNKGTHKRTPPTN